MSQAEQMFDALQAHHALIKHQRIAENLDQARVKAFSIEAEDLYFDYSKTSLDEQARFLMLALIEERGLYQKRDAMFRGEKINITEDRAVLHTALRQPLYADVKVDGQNVVPAVHQVLDAMSEFSEQIRSGEIRGSTGKPFTDVVNIGIGGSDLGPVMAVQALAPYHDGPRTHFVSNVDGAHIQDVLRPLNPETTLVLIASKTFTTIETMTNAQTALKWLDALPDTSAHLAAISTAEDKTAAFGIKPERVFGFEDWVGGRYSMWGPIGLSIMLAIGSENFREFLAGAHEMDQHFLRAEGEHNLPIMLAAVGLWHRNVCGYDTRAVLPYEERLKRLPAYLQQLDMESNGKSVDMDGNPTVHTGPVVWGEPGTNGQHAFYQLIHQGTDIIPCEFMVGKSGHEPELAHQHQLLVANCLAQSQALLVGRSYDEALEIVKSKGYEGAEAERQAKHRVFEGNRPSTTLVYPLLTPKILGKIVALYEHRVFVEGVIWGINSFDQWGVELGKELANALEPALNGQQVESLDASTSELVSRLR